ncbi:MAG: hypothetical protein GX621_03480, partial [Pirellulaceae bacterium]|nr:hypothetical protein [Pirellulaceae bacterium]
MMIHCKTLTCRRGWAAILVLALSMSFAASSAPAAETETPPLTGSIRWIPEDAAVYAAVLRGREQFDA